MNLLQLIKEAYLFKEVEWYEKNIIKTEQGLKKIKYWKEKKLLDWHKSWRNNCSSYPFITTDRPYQTVSGEKEVALENGWFTLHDEVRSLYPMKGKERVWGELFANLISYGNKVSPTRLPKAKEYPLLYELPSIELLEKDDDEIKDTLLSCVREGKLRSEKAIRLTEEADIPLPFLDPILSPLQGKEVFNSLFWEGTALYPERGFHSFIKFLLQWLQKNGETSMFDLLREIDTRCNLKRDYGKIILAEALFPWELIDVLQKWEQATDSKERKQSFSLFRHRWNSRQKLVSHLCDWLEEERKKAALHE